MSPSTSTPDSLWHAVEHLRSAYERHAAPHLEHSAHAGHSDVRAAVLALLAEKPLHGYQIIHEIEERSGGAWKPSAGSVYPTLQMLVDEGLIVSVEADGRKTYELTESGQAAASDAGSVSWDGSSDDGGASSLPKAAMGLGQAAMQVRHSGTPEQIAEATAIVSEARRRLYSILARS